MGKEQLCVALDFDNEQEALSLLESIGPNIGWVKIGMQLFANTGPAFVKKVVSRGYKVFLDIKYHDIPNTVSRAAIEVTKLGVSMFNIHVAGGSAMMRMTKERVAEYCRTEGVPMPKIIGVTILTSITPEQVRDELCVQLPLEEYVVHLAKLAQDAGLDGVVASPKEAPAIRKACGPDFFIVTPGIRPAWSAKNDQKRIMTPAEAVENGADIMVIGRPITKADNPKEAVQKVLHELQP